MAELNNKITVYSVSPSGAVSVDLDNQMDSVIVDADRHPIKVDGSDQKVEFTASLWIGTTKLNVTDVELQNLPPDVMIGVNMYDQGYRFLMFGSHATMAEDTYDVIVNVTAEGGYKGTAHFFLMTVAEDKPKYAVLPSVDFIALDVDNKLSTEIISANVTKQIGNTITDATADDGTLTYEMDASGVKTPVGIGEQINLVTIGVKRSMHFEFTDKGNVVRDAETVLILKDGPKGDSAIFADMTNDMDSVALTKDGKVMGTTTLSTDVKMWHGLTEITDFTISPSVNSYVTTAVEEGHHVTFTINGGTDFPKRTTVDLTLTATINGQHYTQVLTFSIAGIRAGADGVAKTYRIVTSTNVIQRDKNGVLNPSTLAATRYVIENGVETKSTEGVFQRTQNDSTGRDYVANDEAFPIGDIAGLRKITFYWEDGNGNLLDKETVPVVFDGVDGADGQDGQNGQDGQDGQNGQDGADSVTYEIVPTPSVLSFGRDSQGNLQSSRVITSVKVLRHEGGNTTEVSLGEFLFPKLYYYDKGRGAVQITSSSQQITIDKSYLPNKSVALSLWSDFYGGAILASCDVGLVADGPIGPIGPIGPQGPQGDKGDKGDNGQNGKDAPDAKLRSYNLLDDSGLWMKFVDGSHGWNVRVPTCISPDNNQDNVRSDIANGYLYVSESKNGPIEGVNAFFSKIHSYASEQSVFLLEQYLVKGSYASKLVNGQTYTLSFYLRGRTIIQFLADGNQYPYVPISVDANSPQVQPVAHMWNGVLEYQCNTGDINNWTRVWLRFRMTDDADPLRLRFYINYNSGAVIGSYCYCDIACPKLEAGSGYSDWCGSLSEEMGAQQRIRKWEEGKHYYSGVPGEPYYNIATFGEYQDGASVYYLCTRSIPELSKHGTNDPVTSIENHLGIWKQVQKEEFVWAGKISADQIDTKNLIAENIYSVGENGATVKINNGQMEFLNKNGVANIRLGFDAQGNVCLNFYDQNGTFKYGLGPNEFGALDVREASWDTANYEFLSTSLSEVVSGNSWKKMTVIGQTRYKYTSKIANGQNLDPTNDQHWFDVKDTIPLKRLMGVYAPAGTARVATREQFNNDRRKPAGNNPSSIGTLYVRMIHVFTNGALTNTYNIYWSEYELGPLDRTIK